MIKELLDGIQQRLTDGWHWVFAPFQWLIDWWPMMGHFAIFVAVILVFGFVARFLPDGAKKWLFVALLFAMSFIAGEVNQFRARLAEEKKRRLEADRREAEQPPPPQTEDQGARWNPFGKW